MNEDDLKEFCIKKAISQINVNSANDELTIIFTDKSVLKIKAESSQNCGYFEISNDIK
jgi:hypothetical protein